MGLKTVKTVLESVLVADVVIEPLILEHSAGPQIYVQALVNGKPVSDYPRTYSAEDLNRIADYFRDLAAMIPPPEAKSAEG